MGSSHLLGSLILLLHLLSTSASACWTSVLAERTYANFAGYSCYSEVQAAKDACAASYNEGGAFRCTAITYHPGSYPCSSPGGIMLMRGAAQPGVPGSFSYDVIECGVVLPPPPPPPPPPALCGELPVPLTPILCSATTDVLLVIDASSSMAATHDNVTDWMRQFVDRFGLDLGAPAVSPRVGVVTFAGPDDRYNLEDFAEEDAAHVLVGLTADRARVLSLLASRDPSRGSTCISCGLLVARQHLHAQHRPSAVGVVIVVTDGAQTVVDPTGETAIQYAKHLQSQHSTLLIAADPFGFLLIPSDSFLFLAGTPRISSQTATRSCPSASGTLCAT